MTISIKEGRQERIVAEAVINYSDFATSGAAEAVFKIPPNAIYLGGFIDVITAFDSATSDTLDVGDATDDDRYTASAIDLQALGRTALSAPQTFPADGFADEIRLLWTGAGAAPAAGKFHVIFEYCVQNRSTFVTTV